MHKKNYKGKCIKRKLGKCEEVCRTFSEIADVYAQKLEESPEIAEIRCNVLLDGFELGEYTSDFVCKRNLMLNVIADKREHCRKFGISIGSEDWNVSELPTRLVTDKGSEYKSENFEQISELGISVVNLPAYRPELKGPVEKFFDCIQGYFKPYLKGKGVVEPDYQERGKHDYRKDASLTIEQFEKVLIHCILFYNTKRILEGFPFTEEMLEENISPYPNVLWNIQDLDTLYYL